MARPLRIQYPGAWYHVMNRGAGKQPVFCDDADYAAFLILLGEASQMWKAEIHAYCLMPNHYHLLLRTPLANLSRVMRHINSVYTQRYNRCYQRDGALFRGRFKAILIEEDAYLDELFRYIHLNPVKAELVTKPQSYPWSSFAHYLGKSEKPACLVTDVILQRFGSRQNKARRGLVEFTAAGIPPALQEKLAADRWPSILSKELYQDWVKSNYVSARPQPEVTIRFLEPETFSLEHVRKTLCRVSGLSWKETKEGKTPEAGFWRKATIFALRREFGLSYHKIARVVGNVHPSQISRLVNAQRASMEEDPRWRRLCHELKKEKGVKS